MTTSTLLEGPAPNITVSRIDFTKTSLPQYKDYYAVILDGVLSPQECQALVQAAEAHANGTWERAMINAGGGREVMAPDTRNCGRIIWDSHELTQRLWSRIESHVPELHVLKDWPCLLGPGPTNRGEVWDSPRLNERMRFLKYTKGEYFRPHCDGCYETPEERTYLTLHLYLNDATTDPSNQLKGGATSFFEPGKFQPGMFSKRFDVLPKAGRVLLFQHRGMVHSGDEVRKGVKLTMRTEIMYKRPVANKDKPTG